MVYTMWTAKVRTWFAKIYYLVLFFQYSSGYIQVKQESNQEKMSSIPYTNSWSRLHYQVTKSSLIKKRADMKETSRYHAVENIQVSNYKNEHSKMLGIFHEYFTSLWYGKLDQMPDREGPAGKSRRWKFEYQSEHS